MTNYNENPSSVQEMPLLDAKLEALQKEYYRLSEVVQIIERIGSRIKVRLNGEKPIGTQADKPGVSDTFSKIDQLSSDFQRTISQLEEVTQHLKKVIGVS